VGIYYIVRCMIQESRAKHVVKSRRRTASTEYRVRKRVWAVVCRVRLLYVAPVIWRGGSNVRLYTRVDSFVHDTVGMYFGDLITMREERGGGGNFM
jgi:hypothetical protein